MVFAYMGPGEPPLLPAYAVLKAPPDRRLATKYFHECNYLQGLEGNMDGTHVRFLHRFLRTDQGAKALESHPSKDNIHFRDPEPGQYHGPVDIEVTDFGVWSRGMPEFIFPSFCLTGGGPQGKAREDAYMLYWRVPIDDTHHWLFVLAFQLSEPFDPQRLHQWTWGLVGPDYRFLRNKGNRYLQDREEQRTATFTGMGSEFPPQDTCVNEGAGLIQDRTKEHLGAADATIPVARKLILQSIRMVAEGEEPPGLIRDPRVNEVDPLFLKKNSAPTLQKT